MKQAHDVMKSGVCPRDLATQDPVQTLGLIIQTP